MLITTNQINLIKHSKPNNQFKRNNKPKLLIFDDRINYEKAEALKGVIRSFAKHNGSIKELTDKLINEVEKFQGVIE